MKTKMQKQALACRKKRMSKKALKDMYSKDRVPMPSPTICHKSFKDYDRNKAKAELRKLINQ